MKEQPDYYDPLTRCQWCGNEDKANDMIEALDYKYYHAECLEEYFKTKEDDNISTASGKGEGKTYPNA